MHKRGNCFHVVLTRSLNHCQWAAVAYRLERRIRYRNEDFEREFESPLTRILFRKFENRDAQ